MKLKSIYSSVSVVSASLALSFAPGWVHRAVAETLQPEIQSAGLGRTTPIESPDLELFSNLQTAQDAKIEESTVSFDANSASLLAAISTGSDAITTTTTEPLIPVANNTPTKIARLDLDLLCRRFPLNSRCQGAPTENGQPMPSQPEATPAPAELAPDGPTPEAQTQKNKKVGFAIAPSISTLGLGVELTKSIVPHLNARISANLFDFKFGNQLNDVEYDAKVKLLNLSFIGDMYPWKKSGFHLSVGAMFSNNKLDGQGAPMSGEFTIGGKKYTVDEVGSVKAKVTYPGHIAPYVGLGWGNPVAFNKNLSVNINAGVVFTGAPNVDFDATIKITNPDAVKQIQESIEKERKSLQNKLDQYSIYPVLSISISYQF